MPPVVRLFVVVVVLSAGIGGAMMFRKQQPPGQPIDPPGGDLALRSDRARIVAGPTQTGTPPGRFDNDAWSRAATPVDEVRQGDDLFRDWSSAAPPSLSPISPIDVGPRDRSEPRVAHTASGDVPRHRRTSTPTIRTHRIVDGDTLTKLADRYLGDAERWPEIYDFNRDILVTPHALPLGVELRIPPREPAEREQGSSPGFVPLAGW